MGTANLLEAIRLICPETIIQMCSTSEVYGTPQTTPIREDHPLQPPNPYSVSKLAQERLAWAYYKSWGLNVVITRMFAYINPRRRDLFASAFAQQLVDFEKGGSRTIRHGNLDSIRTLIDVRDAMRSYWIASERCRYGIPYNIGGSEPISISEFLMRLIKISGYEILTYLDENLLRPSDITSQVPDTSRFDTLTGWKPRYTLDESIEFLLNFYRRENK